MPKVLHDFRSVCVGISIMLSLTYERNWAVFRTLKIMWNACVWSNNYLLLVQSCMLYSTSREEWTAHGTQVTGWQLLGSASDSSCSGSLTSPENSVTDSTMESPNIHHYKLAIVSPSKSSNGQLNVYMDDVKKWVPKSIRPDPSSSTHRAVRGGLPKLSIQGMFQTGQRRRAAIWIYPESNIAGWTIHHWSGCFTSGEGQFSSQHQPTSCVWLLYTNNSFGETSRDWTCG